MPVLERNQFSKCFRVLQICSLFQGPSPDVLDKDRVLLRIKNQKNHY